ncbi:MAG: hypothetical protein RLN60_03475 [Phycisphaerales bacterium]
MTTIPNDQSINSSEPADQDPCETVEEFRVGTLAARLNHYPDMDEFVLILASDAKGLDDPNALRVFYLWELRNILEAVNTRLELFDSASLSEERIANRESVRLGLTHTDCEPMPWDKTPDLYPGAEKRPRRPEGAQRGDRVRHDFKVAGLYGRVEGESGADPDTFNVYLANWQHDLDLPRALCIRSHSAAYQALWAASVLVDIGSDLSEFSALAYRELARHSVTLLDSDE